MGYPTPSFVIKGVRQPLKTARVAGMTESLTTRKLLKNRSFGYSGRPESNPTSFSSGLVSKSLQTTTKNRTSNQSNNLPPMMEIEASRFNSFGTTNISLEADWFEQQRAFSGPEELEPKAPTISDEPSSLSTSQLNPVRVVPNLAALKPEERFYNEVNAYTRHFEPLLRAELEEANSQVLERLSKWEPEKLRAEGYMVDQLSAFPFRRSGEKAHDGFTWAFVPPAGERLGDTLLTRGVQVTVIPNDEDPLKDRDSDAMKRGVIVYSGGDGIRVKFQDAGCVFPVNSRWRLDLGICDVPYLLTMEALRALHFDPSDAEEQKMSDEEVVKKGTDLREELLSGWWRTYSEGNTHEPGSSAHTTKEVSIPSGFLAKDENIRDWSERYSQRTPTVKEGDPTSLLNETQIRGIAQIFREKISLIQGPPGTGKTRTIVEAVRLLKQHFKTPHPLLICTYTNVAVDNLVEGLVAAGLRPLRVGSDERVREGLSQWTLQAYYKRHKLWPEYSALQQRLDLVRAQYQKSMKDRDTMPKVGTRALSEKISLLRNRIWTLRKSMDYDIFREADVVCTTSLFAGSSTLNAIDFPVVFIDEASMSTEPSSLIPLMRGSQQLALIGDHQQLPPVITSNIARDGGLARSLFERLIEEKTFPSIMLDVQYRMHPAISAFPNQAFYGTALKDGMVSASGDVPSHLHPPHSRELSLRKYKNTGRPTPVLFIHHENEEKLRARSRINEQEMRYVMAILQDLLLSNPGMKGSDIGVIAPYVAQIRMLNSMLKTEQAWREEFVETLGSARAAQMRDIEVKTVDGFEGREKDVIIFSTVRNNDHGQIGFLADRRRMNVALTRAKRALFVLGNMKTLLEGKCGHQETVADAVSQGVKKQVAKRTILSSGDEWKKYIRFIGAEHLFVEVLRDGDASQLEVLETPSPWAVKHLLSI